MYAPNIKDVVEALANDPKLGTYTPDSVEREPASSISYWSIKQVPDFENKSDVSHHIVGLNARTYDGRVSSKIMAFDKRTMTCTTRSGRKYILVGQPGHNMDADYVWNRWLTINKVNPDEAKDVTPKYSKP